VRGRSSSAGSTTRRFLRLIKDAAEQGTSVIVISHNLEHVIEVADRAVVLRQGRYVGEEKPTKESQEKLVSMIVGGGDAD
jgi:D-xylose transport system ATP-binding protein